MSAEGNGVAVDGHCGGNTVKPSERAVSVGVAGKAAAGGDGPRREVSRIERLEAAYRVGKCALAGVEGVVCVSRPTVEDPKVQ